jgi:hypothetical protein
MKKLFIILSIIGMLMFVGSASAEERAPYDAGYHFYDKVVYNVKLEPDDYMNFGNYILFRPVDLYESADLYISPVDRVADTPDEVFNLFIAARSFLNILTEN